MKNYSYHLRKGIVSVSILMLISFSSSAQTLQFYQLNLNYDSIVSSYSDWGAADLTFTGDTNILYFNLTRDTDWVIENIPILSIEGVGVLQTQRIWFDIGTNCVPVTGIGYGFSLTPDTVSTMPAVNNSAIVQQDQVIIFSGLIGGPPPGGYPGAESTVGQKMLDTVQHRQKGVPFWNQECGTNECVPASISNSLNWLNAQFNLGMAGNDISISEVGAGMGLTPQGVDAYTIYSSKKEFCKNKKKLPVTTEKTGGTNFAKVMDEIDRNCDVEIIVKWGNSAGKGHAVAVRGITDEGNGKFSIYIVSDTKQDSAGGLAVERTTYDPNAPVPPGPKWDGPFAKASGLGSDFFFVAECAVQKHKANSNAQPTGKKQKTYPKRSTPFNSNQFYMQNLELSGYNSIVPAPALGNNVTFSYSGSAALEVSADSGVSFQSFTAPYSAGMRVSHVLDSTGTEYYFTELTSLSVSGGTLPANIQLRESPLAADSSTGLMTIKQIAASDYDVYSYMDVFFQLSMDSGTTWLPSDHETSVIYSEDTLTITTDVPSSQDNTSILVSNLLSASGNNILMMGSLPEASVLKIYNTMGQQIYYSKNYKNDFSVSQLPAGVYLYILHVNNNNLLNGKFVVSD